MRTEGTDARWLQAIVGAIVCAADATLCAREIFAERARLRRHFADCAEPEATLMFSRSLAVMRDCKSRLSKVSQGAECRLRDELFVARVVGQEVDK